ncbi:MAG: GNAT family N-acetyltransferase [Marinomonas sp.]|jgi:N-acetylglutamate synthase-like GNAT family acetyltransferase|uniref:GNAT family N-acetyltransferase n=1 Tax=unclassified Marinomonas TaxID=196814 RepID=UPI0007AEF69C|nr:MULTISPECIES: GNAT family N-acetyltransferase [unclassified Marinomonas]KZM38802.1 acetyltransferase [Marinomonas sp. SBI22]KZM39423.1 acetyltransferase [Marinomonas sp. SBI8L]
MPSTLTHKLIDKLHFPLAKKFYQAHYPSGKANKADPIWALTEGYQIRVCLRLKQFEDCQLLTAMVTHPNFRKQGLGKSLLTALISDSTRPLLTKPCYCFAFTHLEGFYQKAGFTSITVEELPIALKSRYLAYTQSGKALIPMKFALLIRSS